MSEFFMLVTQRREDGWLKGISMFDASDFKDITWIPQRSPTHDFPAWDWLKMTSPSGDDVAGPEAAPALARGTEAELRGALERMDQWVGVLHSQIADLQQHVNNLNALRAKDSGDVDEVAEHLASVGRRVQALEAKGEVSIRKEPRTKAK
jgi:hypothetical protein